MNNFFTQLKEMARAIKLSRDEKQVMRMSLYTYFEKNPMGTFDAPKKITKPVPSMYYFFSPRYMVPVALLLVVGLSGGTAFAAEGALPGNPLYAVKIQVNERVAVALARTPEAKASVHASLATTRLEEAETLAAHGKLDATATAELANNFVAHSEAAQSNASDVETNDPGMAAQLGAQFNGALSAHGAILAQLGDDSADAETMQNSRSLAMEVAKETERGTRHNSGEGVSVVLALADAPAPEVPASAAHVRTFAATAQETAGSASSSVQAPTSTKSKAKDLHNSGTKEVSKESEQNTQRNAQIVASLSTQAASSLAIVSADLAAFKSLLDEATAAQITAQIAGMQTLLASANASLTAGDTSTAKNDFESVIHSSIKLDAYLKAGQKFNQHLLNGLLDNSGGNDHGSNGDSSQGSDEGVKVDLHL